MKCLACQHDNPDRARFCLECGAPFSLRCLSCDVELPPNAKFCLECGTAQVKRETEQEGRSVRRDPRAYTPKHLVDKILQSKS